MKNLRPFLIFAGDCEEALTHYSQCLGGEIVMLQRYSASPLDVAPAHGNRVYNSVFRSQDVTFMASENLPGQQLHHGTNFSMFVSFSDPHEQERVFAELATDGRVLMQLNNGFGMIEDRFRVRWMLAWGETTNA